MCKKLYTYCLVLVGSRNGIKSVSISLSLSTKKITSVPENYIVTANKITFNQDILKRNVKLN
jgi:hypothetical protein